MKKIKLKVRSKLPDIVPGTKVYYHGHPFIALGAEQSGLLVIAEKPIEKNMPFDEKNRADWRVSSLREYLNGDYLREIGGADGLMPFESDLTADDGRKDYGTAKDLVFLLSDNLYRKYRDYIPNYDTLWWTITPLSSSYPSYGDYERVVHSSGALSYYIADNSYGVVPCLLLNLSSVDREDSPCDSRAGLVAC